MTRDCSRLKKFVKKFIGIVRFRNDHFGAIMGYGDYVVGDSVIFRVYYMEGLGHNLFSVKQFYDSDMEVAFRKHSCYVHDTDGVELIKGSRGSNLYTISVEDMIKSSPICLLSKAFKTKSYSACQLGKGKKHTHSPKAKNTNLEVLNTLHMDLCGPMRVQKINGKKYILVIVDDYTRFTWVKFFKSKDETPDVVIKFLKQIQVGLNKTVRFIGTNNGTEFVNHDLTHYYESVDIFHKKQKLLLLPVTPKADLSFTLVITKPLYELMHNKKPNLTFLRVFGALCYPTNDSEDLGKISSGLVPNLVPAAPYVPPTNKELEILFQPMFDEYLEPSRVEKLVSPAPAVLVPVLVNSARTPSSNSIDQDAPSLSHSPSSLALQSPCSHQGVAAESTLMDENPFALADNDPFISIFASEPTYAASSSGDASSAESPYVTQTLYHLRK
nr:integrase, catalytic region, zinc finger, CCHC-type, peptidase aspartic, catalytic [Tanacetum cinerariifolium]